MSLLSQCTGPPSESWAFGALPAVIKYVQVSQVLEILLIAVCLYRRADPGAVHGEWMKQYGFTMWYKGFLGVSVGYLHCQPALTVLYQSPRIWTADPGVIQYLLQHAYDYPKDEGQVRVFWLCYRLELIRYSI